MIGLALIISSIGQLNLRNSFSEYFPGKSPNFNYNQKGDPIELQPGNSYFYDCSFIGVSSVTYGGAIHIQDYLTPGGFYLVIEKCTFRGCTTTTQYRMASYGGAIYFSVSKGGVGMGDTVATGCYTGSGGGGDGQFAKISGLEGSLVNIKRTSITMCGMENDYRKNVLSLEMKTQQYYNSNISNNKAEQTASVNFFFPDNMVFAFSTISNNWAKYINILMLAGGKSNTIQNLIFVKNSMGTAMNSGIIHNLAGANTVFQGCTFLNNMQNKVGVLFYIDSGSLIVRNYECDSCKPKNQHGTVIFQ